MILDGSERVKLGPSLAYECEWLSELNTSGARQQARQAKPHPSHQSPIQLWLGLSVACSGVARCSRCLCYELRCGRCSRLSHGVQTRVACWLGSCCRAPHRLTAGCTYILHFDSCAQSDQADTLGNPAVAKLLNGLVSLERVHRSSWSRCPCKLELQGKKKKAVDLLLQWHMI